MLESIPFLLSHNPFGKCAGKIAWKRVLQRPLFTVADKSLSKNAFAHKKKRNDARILVRIRKKAVHKSSVRVAALNTGEVLLIKARVSSPSRITLNIVAFTPERGYSCSNGVGKSCCYRIASGFKHIGKRSVAAFFVFKVKIKHRGGVR